MKAISGTLIQAIKSGTSSVTEFVTEEYCRNVYSLAQSMVNDSDTALEITCKAFSDMFCNGKKITDISSFEKQLYSLCRTLCLNFPKKQNKHTDNATLCALYSLPVKYRSILILNDIYSFTLRQTALLWDISEQKAQRTLNGGRKMIGNIIKKQISK